MTQLETIAASVSKTIARRWLNVSIPAREEIAALIVRELRPIVVEQKELHFTTEDAASFAEQRRKILQLLKERRSEGALTTELAALALQYNARIHELRHDENYKITAERGAGRVYRYRLSSLDW